MCFSLLAALFFFPAPTVSAAGEDEPEGRIPGPMVLPQSWPGGEVMPAGITAVMNHFSYSEAKLYKGSSRYDPLRL